MSTAGRKLFVGSLPPGIDDSTLRNEFSKYGVVEDIFVKPNCDPSKQWAFVTMAAPAQAEAAKVASDRILFFPGAERPCDVMVAKNQGMFGQPQEVGPPVMAGVGDYSGQTAWPDPQMQQQQQQPQFAEVQPTKIFVGSLPDGITDLVLREEYSKYGAVSDVFVKPNCEPGRQWAFIMFRSMEEASYALQMTNGILQFPGSFKTVEVTMARNQGMFGKDPIMAGPPRLQDPYGQPQVTENVMAPKKIFVGSLPLHISDEMLRAEFSQYGQVTDVHINNKPCDSGRQWAFVTFVNAEQASHAKISCDRILVFPGAEKACEVTLARHQGQFGQESIVDGERVGASTAGAPKKIFVGSLPESANDAVMRQEFGKYGQVTDVYISTKPCEPGRNWAFVSFATPQMAQFAKDSCDRVLWMPGADRPCEVMLAKNQGKFGQENMAQAPMQQPPPNKGGGWVVPAIMTPPGKGGGGMAMGGGGGMAMGGGLQPPPPTAPPPAHLTPWRMYKTAAGLPYYHNNITQVTQWECPPELQAPSDWPQQAPGQSNVYQLPPGSPAAAKGYMPY